MTGVQMKRLQLLYEKMSDDSEVMQELEEIIDYAASEMKTTISNGAEIYEFVEQNLTITPVGLVPLNTNEGYFFLSAADARSTRVYHYRLSIFDRHNEPYRSIQTTYVEEQQRGIAHTYESIKSDLIRYRSDLPHPAVYSIETKLSFPVNETLLPIAKRSLVRYIS